MKYTEEQVAISLASEPRLLVRALAGTGKTETVALRIIRKVESGVKPSDILCLTFTNAAVNQLRQRLDSKGLHEVKVKTIDAHAYSVVMPYLEEQGILVSLTDGQEVARKLLNGYGLSSRNSEVKNLVRMASLRWMGRPLKMTIPGITAEDVDKVIADYDNEKRKQHLVDFTDILVLATGIETKKHQEVIVDEAQDATSAHLRFIEHVVGEQLTLVGDENQSIFGFSGVDPDYFKTYCKGWRELTLSQSFRSNGDVLDVVNGTQRLDAIKLRTASEARGSLYQGDSVLKTVTEALEMEGSKAFLGRTRMDLTPIYTILKASGLTVGASWEGHPHHEYEFYVSTVHAAKGLEWDTVAVFNLVEHGFRGVMEDEDDIQDEMRLAYVAASRAKSNLLLHTFDGNYPYNLREKKA